MNNYLYPKFVINNRPLIFLCGPYCMDTDDKDRRNILRKYLSKLNFTVENNGREFEISPFPLIIDNLFSTDKLKESIGINVVEEIVANSSV